jgi:hypothetical protein
MTPVAIFFAEKIMMFHPKNAPGLNLSECLRYFYRYLCGIIEEHSSKWAAAIFREKVFSTANEIVISPQIE